MKVPLVDLQAQYRSIRREVLENIEQVLGKCNFILGEEVRLFEEEFASFCGARFGVGVASGTDAVHLAVRAAGIGPGDECLIPANTFIATALGVTYAGATPVPVDVDPETFLMDEDKIEEAVTPRTRAVIPVHLFGRMMDLRPVEEIARRRNLHLIEDAAQAHGAEIGGRRAGSVGTYGCFSFYPGKNLGAYGDAGLVTTNDPDRKARIEALRNYGSTRKYDHPVIGFNSRLDTVQAAVLRVKLRHLSGYNEARREAARKYSAALAGVGDLMLPEVPGDGSHVFHLYVVRTAHRDALLEYLASRDVHASIHYPVPVHLQGVYAGLGIRPGSLPAAERLAGEILSLPIFPEITDGQVAHVVDSIRAYFALRGRTV